MFRALEVAGNNYPVVVEKLKEGLGFYRRLSGNVTKLRDRVREILRQHRASDREKGSELTGERTEQSAGSQQPTGVYVCVCARVRARVCVCVHAFVHINACTHISSVVNQRLSCVFPTTVCVYINVYPITCRPTATEATKEI